MCLPKYPIISAILLQNHNALKYFPKRQYFREFRELRALKLIFSRKNIPFLRNEEYKTSIVANYAHAVAKIIDEVTHLDEVRKAQKTVKETQDKLTSIGEKRRSITNDLANVRITLQELHLQIANTNRTTSNYLELIKEEIKAVQDDKNLSEELQRVDNLERTTFAELSNGLNDLFEQEKIHSRIQRNWAIMCTIFGSCITFIITQINYYREKNRVTNIIQSLKSDFEKTLDNKMGTLRGDITSMVSGKKSLSWGEFFKKHTSSVYYYFIPKSR